MLIHIGFEGYYLSTKIWAGGNTSENVYRTSEYTLEHIENIWEHPENILRISENISDYHLITSENPS